MTFTARGRLTLANVVFVIEAKDQDEAWAKAMAGDYVRKDLRYAVALNWKIAPDSLEGHE